MTAWCRCSKPPASTRSARVVLVLRSPGQAYGRLPPMMTEYVPGLPPTRQRRSSSCARRPSSPRRRVGMNKKYRPMSTKTRPSAPLAEALGAVPRLSQRAGRLISRLAGRAVVPVRPAAKHCNRAPASGRVETRDHPSVTLHARKSECRPRCPRRIFDQRAAPAPVRAPRGQWGLPGGSVEIGGVVCARPSRGKCARRPIDRRGATGWSRVSAPALQLVSHPVQRLALREHVLRVHTVRRRYLADLDENPLALENSVARRRRRPMLLSYHRVRIRDVVPPRKPRRFIR